MSATPEIIGVFCRSAPQELLEISRRPSQTTARYVASQALGQYREHEGEINLLREDVEKLSEELLSPVLFPQAT